MTVYANLVNGEIKGVYDLIPKFWNGHNHFNVLCAKDEKFMRENGFVKIIRDTTPYDSTTHRMSDYPTYSVVDEEVYEHREITLIPPPLINEEDLLTIIRKQRDQKMKDFEWRYTRYFRETRLGLSTTDDLKKLDEYMQLLADITDQEDLTNIIWPTYEE